MADFATIRDLKQSLIRKPLAGAILMAPYTTVLPTTYFTSVAPIELVDLKAAGFTSIGHVSRENAPTFTPETETAEVESWGLLEAARMDMISRRTTISWTGQETHKLNLELWHNADLSTVEHHATTGETSFADPTEPSITYRRAVFVSIDGSGANRIYMIRECPKFTVTEVSEQTMNQESAIEYGITGRAFIDEDAGYSMKTIFGGPGWLSIATDAGFPVATP
ncbi:hypothetical protein IU485_28030 [Nocardia cyriacigeorgica]|uniref:phage tail tube protein n=1 Tax=Nocardia cyriacigeorgica TaxID=135487 RepID=UPI0018942D59|nr:hypothetical protein [Nocardia cyriacigeorgica]MBF6085222.1 hypothetical protein [Nocardia cyriacigeorgica]